MKYNYNYQINVRISLIILLDCGGNMLKVGIMTLWAAFDNYGQQYQVFSLQHFLRKQGYDSYIIRYEYKKDIRRKKWYEYFYTLKYLLDIKYVVTRIRNLKHKDNPIFINRGFDTFAKKNIVFSSRVYHNLSELQLEPPEADIYIVGSDQVWNFSNQYRPYSNKIQAYYLNFGNDDICRIAYAASFAKDSYGKKLKQYVEPFLHKFSFISCRENQGVDICKSMGVSSKLTLDPVFLNNKEDYVSIIKDLKPLENDDFCVLYLLGNATQINYEAIDAFANDNGCKIICIPGKGFHQKKYKEVFPTPEEWLWYINNARYIITNSFHGTAFAILLNKNFSVLPLSGKNSLNQNDRIFTMLKILEIDSSVIGLEKNPMQNIFNWEKISELINEKNEEVGLLKFIKQYEK